MKQFRPCVDFSLFVFCALLSFYAAICVYGESVQKGNPSQPSMIVPPMFDIYGIVIDATPDLSQEKLAKLATPSLSGKDYIQALTEIFEGRPASNIVVAVRSKSVTRETVADSEGKFRFTSLPAGDYEVSAQMPSPPSGQGSKLMATVKQRIRLDSNEKVDLRLRVDLITVKGRITDANGKPVAGAKVIVVEEIDDPGNMLNTRTYSTVSNADGSYELQGLEPTDLTRITAYLYRASPRALDYVTIHVEADGFAQGKESVPKVPLLTEALLCPARCLLKAESQRAVRNGGAELREKDGLSIPSSHGNTITGIDIVLKKAGEGGR